jgi:hypothetical protein
MVRVLALHNRCQPWRGIEFFLIQFSSLTEHPQQRRGSGQKSAGFPPLQSGGGAAAQGGQNFAADRSSAGADRSAGNRKGGAGKIGADPAGGNFMPTRAGE